MKNQYLKHLKSEKMYCPNCKKETDSQICPNCGTNLKDNVESEVHYYVMINDQQSGPYYLQQLTELVQKGQLNQQTFVWKNGMPQWSMAQNVDELLPLLPVTPPPQPPIQQLNSTIERKPLTEQKQNSKAGVIKKCPVCGQSIPSGAAVCPECGYAFHTGQKDDTLVKLQTELREIDQEYSIKKKELQDESRSLLNSLKKKDERSKQKHWELERISELNKELCERKSQAIRNIVVSNSRGDLLSLLAFSKPKANRFGPKEGYTTYLYAGEWDNIDQCFLSEDLSFAYWSLFENCINMAQVNFVDDRAFYTFFDYFSRRDDPNTFKNFYLNLKESEHKFANSAEYQFAGGSHKKKHSCVVQVLLAPFKFIWWLIKIILEIVTLGAISKYL